MAIEILMPALSPTMEEGTLAKWHVKEGDKVSSGDVIAEIETDKATMEVEAVDEGTVAKILVAAGTENVKVNVPIAVLVVEGEDASAVDAPKPQAKSNGSGAAPAAAPPAAPAAAPSVAAATAAPAAPVAAHGPRLSASPLARRLAKERGIDISALSGSGPHGRIVKRDVLGAKPGAAPKPQPSAAPAETKAPAGQPAKLPNLGYAEGTFTAVPLDGMRKTIARRLTQSKVEVPHYYLTIDCELDKLLAMRTELNAMSPQGQGAFKISVNDFLIRAAALALIKVPDANASWADDVILRHHSADVAVAVAIDGGLITPIIRKAESKGLGQIAREAKVLAEKARARKLKPEEYQGGTFSISNLGMFGIKSFTAVINPPHSMIMAVGAGEQRPVVRNGALAVATVMTVTLSCDHRVVDGALGARFLEAFKAHVEAPLTMML